MKKLTHLLFLFFLYSISYSQPFGYFTFNSGLTVPTGKYKSINNSDSAVGYAMNGYMIKTALGININQYYGVSATYYWQSNKFDEVNFIRTSVEKFPSIKWKATATPWHFRDPLIGFFTTNNLNDWLLFDTKVNLGYLTFYSPQIGVSASSKTNTITINYLEATKNLLFIYLELVLKPNLPMHLLFV